jgi:hypothetical protein
MDQCGACGPGPGRQTHDAAAHGSTGSDPAGESAPQWLDQSVPPGVASQVRSDVGCRGSQVKDMSVSEHTHERLYRYCWGNNSRRKQFKGRVCRVLARGAMNSCLLEFTDTGERVVTSRNAIRRES